MHQLEVTESLQMELRNCYLQWISFSPPRVSAPWEEALVLPTVSVNWFSAFAAQSGAHPRAAKYRKLTGNSQSARNPQPYCKFRRFQRCSPITELFNSLDTAKFCHIMQCNFFNAIYKMVFIKVELVWELWFAVQKGSKQPWAGVWKAAQEVLQWRTWWVPVSWLKFYCISQKRAVLWRTTAVRNCQAASLCPKMASLVLVVSLFSRLWVYYNSARIQAHRTLRYRLNAMITFPRVVTWFLFIYSFILEPFVLSCGKPCVNFHFFLLVLDKWMIALPDALAENDWYLVHVWGSHCNFQSDFCIFPMRHFLANSRDRVQVEMVPCSAPGQTLYLMLVGGRKPLLKMDQSHLQHSWQLFVRTVLLSFIMFSVMNFAWICFEYLQ